MDEFDQALKPVAWLIDEDTEHARVLLGSAWQPSKMGAYNKLLVTLLDAQEAVYRAALAERERWTTLLTERWHSGEGKGHTLAQYIGMSTAEYAAWVVEPDGGRRGAMTAHPDNGKARRQRP